jgi:hypothetical protein
VFDKFNRISITFIVTISELPIMVMMAMNDLAKLNDTVNSFMATNYLVTLNDLLTMNDPLTLDDLITPKLCRDHEWPDDLMTNLVNNDLVILNDFLTLNYLVTRNEPPCNE